jgi:hypothetical protein
MPTFRSIVKELLEIDDQDFDNMSEEMEKENQSYNGIQGIRGLLGKPVGYSRPAWVQDIIDFRNEKYQEDLAAQKEGVDRKYGKIDSALGKLDCLPIVLKNSTALPLNSRRKTH